MRASFAIYRTYEKIHVSSQWQCYRDPRDKAVLIRLQHRFRDTLHLHRRNICNRKFTKLNSENPMWKMVCSVTIGRCHWFFLTLRGGNFCHHPQVPVHFESSGFRLFKLHCKSRGDGITNILSFDCSFPRA